MPLIIDTLHFSALSGAAAFVAMLGRRPYREAPPPLQWFAYVMLLAFFTVATFAMLTGHSSQAVIFGLVWVLAVAGARHLLPDWDARGHSFFVSFVAGLAVFLLYVQLTIIQSGLSLFGLALSWFLFGLELTSAVLSIFYAFEVLNVMCRTRWRRPSAPVTFPTGYRPKVSVHVPAHAEPVAMVKQTLAALAHLDYPNYEVIMVDDNTDDSELWRPIMDFCSDLGFKVFHLQDYPGFKSGALNFALTQTAQDAEIIAVVDSDYVVEPGYLRETVPHFQNPAVAFLQTPQSFRNLDGYPFRAASALAQRFFFEIGMRSRNERNSIIFCGTMGLIRKSVVKEIGGWSEWCITEDAEASLRILRRGYESVYVNKAYGHGLIPETFEDTKKQRFRWAFGGIQILKRYWRWLLPVEFGRQRHRLSLAQRLDYLLGFMGWFNDLLILGFTAFVLITAISYSVGFDVPVRRLLGLALLLPILAIVTGGLRVAWCLRVSAGSSWRDGLGAFLSMLSLSWTVALACLAALVQKKGVFLRTPKLSGRNDVGRALRVSLWEGVIGTALIVTIVMLLNVTFTAESVLLAILLGWHALIYLSALRASLTEHLKP